MTAPARVVDAFPSGRGHDADALVFEYMAATLAKPGAHVGAHVIPHLDHVIPRGDDERVGVDLAIEKEQPSRPG